WNFKKQSYLHQTVRKINPTKWIGVQKRPLHPAAMSTRLLHKGKAKSKLLGGWLQRQPCCG
ncbi:hypothetical protein BOH78_5010, partial [Pichia kudriavzevii]